MSSHRPLTRSIAVLLSGVLFWNPLLSTAAQTQGGITNEASVTAREAQYGSTQGHGETIDAAARIEAGNSLFMQAGTDLLNRGGVIQQA